MFDAHHAANSVAFGLYNALESGRARSYAHAVASRDLEINHRLAAEVVRLRQDLAAMTRQRDALATALAHRGRI